MSVSSTSSSDRGRAFRFLARAVVFTIPLMLAMVPFEVIFWRSGECWTVKRAADASMGEERTLYLRKYLSQQFVHYKSEMVKRTSPEILVLGSSRALQFRGFMFHPLEGKFYNAGGLVQNVRDLEHSVKLVLGVRPRVVIVTIDPWWIKDDDSGMGMASRRSRELDEAWRPVAHFDGIREMILRGRVSWSLVVRGPAPTPDGYVPVGLAAVEHGSGFRRDGSQHPGTAILEKVRGSREYKDRIGVAAHIRNRTAQFFPAPGIDAGRIDLIVKALKALQGAGIDVRVVLPPFSGECIAALGSTPWWVEYGKRLPEALTSAGIPCLEVLTPGAMGLDDTSMLDGYHPGELLVSKIVERLAIPGVDLRHLGELMKRNADSPVVFR